ncbi:phosphoglycerate mutase [Hydrogenophaga sp.]|uniref:phosphoglycerate mutase n=1 Tax=Hydrogenophaga sp. TaxID=1904254 RepID=UPI0025B7B623|nr:phosphoglycerate mutase [Hydrogenophaga sp.]
MPASHPAPESAHHLLVPFATASAPECRALLSGFALPGLTALLAELTLVASETGDDQDLDAPHERALASALGLQAAGADCLSPGRFPWAAASSEQPLQPQAWFTPSHFQVGMDQVTLLPGDRLALMDADARPLFDALTPLAAEDGIELFYESATRWRATGEPLRDLVCASLDRVSGRSVADWTPTQGRHPLITRLQSEAQMLFYTHPVNDRREAAHQPIVNGFWVHGAGALTQPIAEPQRPTQPDTLRQAALLGDWRSWQQAWQALDSGAIAELLARARAGEPVTLTLCGERGWAQWALRPHGLGQRLIRALPSLRGIPPAWKHLDTL